MKTLWHTVHYGNDLMFDARVDRVIELKGSTGNSYEYIAKGPTSRFEYILFCCRFLLPPRKSDVDRCIGMLVDGTETYVFSYCKRVNFICAAFAIKVLGWKVDVSAKMYDVPYLWRPFLYQFKR